MGSGTTAWAYCEAEGIDLMARIPNRSSIAELYAAGRLLYRVVPEVLHAVESSPAYIRATGRSGNAMKEIVVISGKGGTGKTSLTAAFAVLGGRDLVVADCDVDAADLHLLLEPDFGRTEAFFSGELAVIDPETCSDCGRCLEVCRYDAISVIDGRYSIDEIGCEGCGYCARVCPEGAIANIAAERGRLVPVRDPDRCEHGPRAAGDRSRELGQARRQGQERGQESRRGDRQVDHPGGRRPGRGLSGGLLALGRLPRRAGHRTDRLGNPRPEARP